MHAPGAAAFAVLALVVPGCNRDESSAPPVEDLPAAVSHTRAAILAAAESGDYGLLRPVLEPDVFLSDFGFGDVRDPVARWQKLGPQPLQTMGVLVRMPHAVRQTNEGTLYEWPRFDASSDEDDLTEPERDLLSELMTEEELASAFLPELGYTGPRLGILADGVWWFFVLEGEGG